MTNQIIILANGYAYFDKTQQDVMKANCSCVLIKGANKNLIVDTMTPWDGNFILEALARNGLTPDDINFCISTHGHSDHCGNNNLFLKAKKHILGQNVSHGTDYELHDFNKADYVIDDTILIKSTPGHTMSCVSVVVKDAVSSEFNVDVPGTVAIAGDLFENKDDILHELIWIGAGSENPALQRKNRYEISMLANYIIPGHGEAFVVDDSIRAKLRADVLESDANN